MRDWLVVECSKGGQHGIVEVGVGGPEATVEVSNMRIKDNLKAVIQENPGEL